jgi:RNA chaperone Hfq
MMTDLKPNVLRPPMTKPPQINNAPKPPAGLPLRVPKPAPAPAVPPKPACAAPAEPPKPEPKECDGFLFGRAKGERRPITFRFIDGTEVTGMIMSWSRFGVLLDVEGTITLCFKHALALARLENKREESA